MSVRRCARVVSQCLADLPDDDRQVGLFDHLAGPDLLEQDVLAHDIRASRDEDLEDVEGLRRQVDGRLAPAHLAGAGVEHAGPEADPHPWETC